MVKVALRTDSLFANSFVYEKYTVQCTRLQIEKSIFKQLIFVKAYIFLCLDSLFKCSI